MDAWLNVKAGRTNGAHTARAKGTAVWKVDARTINPMEAVVFVLAMFTSLLLVIVLIITACMYIHEQPFVSFLTTVGQNTCFKSNISIRR